MSNEQYKKPLDHCMALVGIGETLIYIGFALMLIVIGWKPAIALSLIALPVMIAGMVLTFWGKHKGSKIYDLYYTDDEKKYNDALVERIEWEAHHPEWEWREWQKHHP